MKNKYLLMIVILLLAATGFSQSKKSQIISTTDTLWRFLNNRNSLGTSTFGFITGSDTTFVQSDGTILNFISSELLHNGSPIGGASYWDRDANGFLHPLTLSDYIKLDTTAIQGLDTAENSHDAMPMWQIIDSINSGGGSGGSEWTRATNWIYPNYESDSVVIGNDTAYAPLTVYGRIEQRGIGKGVSLGYEAGINDDGTDNANIFIGYKTGYNNISGTNNVAFGDRALYTNESGDYNLSIGTNSMFYSTGADNCVAMGYTALFYQTTGQSNTAIGASSLYTIQTGGYNTAIGSGCMSSVSPTLSANTGVGYRALQGSEGANNTAVGYYASNRTDVGYGNTVMGVRALEENKSGDNNVALGMYALRKCTGNSNVAIGYSALYGGVAAYSNVAIGHQAKNSGTTIGAIAIGYQAQFQSTGLKNTSIGWTAHRFLSTGTYNIALGHEAGYGVQTGSYNITLGYQAGKAMYMTGHYNVLIGNWVEADDKAANYQLNISNLIKGEIDNATVTIHNALTLNPVSASPTSPTLGMLYCDSDDNHLYYYNGSTWMQID